MERGPHHLPLRLVFQRRNRAVRRVRRSAPWLRALVPTTEPTGGTPAQYFLLLLTIGTGTRGRAPDPRGWPRSGPYILAAERRRRLDRMHALVRTYAPPPHTEIDYSCCD